MTLADLSILDQMLAEVARADPLYRPSRYWERLNQDHLYELASPEGFAHFKRSLNESYFQFGFYAFPRALPVLLGRWLRRHDLRAFAARFERPDRARFAALLAPATALYAEAVATLPNGELLWRLEEPPLGDPLVVRWGRKRTTQDLCHSVEELLAVRNAVPRMPLGRVAELGAGYGRTAFAWLRASPDTQYYIVDIPPALYVSQRYLSEVLPEVRVFPFRPFAAYDEVAAELEGAQLAFLLPHQLELLPDRHFELMLTVSTLHEMRRDQIVNYMGLLASKAARAVYIKQWQRWRNPVDLVEVSRQDYAMPHGWRTVFDRSPMLPSNFFEVLYVRE